MNSIIIYKSKTGFTKKYAEMISKSINCNCLSIKESKKVNLKEYDFIIFGGSLYASGIIGLKKLKKRINTQNLIVFAVGLTPMEKNLKGKLLEANFSADEQKNAKLFYFRGGFNLNKLNFIDKKLMLFMKKKIEKKEELTQNDHEFLNAFKKPVNYTDDKEIEPLIKYYNEVCSNE